MNAIIIDFDGTIADSFDHVLDFLLGQTGRTLSDLSPADRQALKGLSMKDLALRVGIPPWRLVPTYFAGKRKMAKRMHQTPVFAGMPEVLAALKSEKYKLFIVSSNSKRNINLFLSEHGLGGYFVRVYANAGWFLGKRTTLRKVAKQNNLDPSNTVYVGDEVRDMLGARFAGMVPVAVNWGFGSEDQLLRTNPTILARSPMELQKSLIDWGRSL